MDVYLPKDKFYSFSTLLPVDGSGSNVKLTDISYTEIPIHIRGGSIIPLRVSSASTTTQLRTKDFELLIAPDSDGFAEGELYLDDGESLIQNSTSDIRFKYDGNVLQMRGTFGYDPGTVKIATITLLGEAPVTKTLDLPLVGGFDILIKSLSSY